MMRKIFAVLTALVMVIVMSGCSSSQPCAGEEYILAARKAYRALDSARVDVINDETGVSEQIFIFKYDEKDLMTYAYIGRDEGTYIAQYNNGYEQFTEENGVISESAQGDKDFAAYSRDVPYPYADEGLILFVKKAVVDEESYIASNEQAIEVCHVYDMEKLGSSAPDSSITGFTVKYFFDGEGNLLYLKEISEMSLPDGSQKTYSYTIYITERNSVETVPNIVNGKDKDKLPEKPSEKLPEGAGVSI